jgi:hypothetical protein
MGRKETQMSNSLWIELPSSSLHRKISPEEEALRENYLVAQKIGFQLLCASNLLLQVQSPDVTACAAVIREAVHKPEKDRANAVKVAEAAILERLVDYISTRTSYEQHREAWLKIRPTLVAHLEAVVAPPTEPGRSTSHYVDIDLSLNCEAVAGLIDDSDIAINNVSKRQYSKPTEKYALAGFQKVFNALAAEVGDPHWSLDARLSCYAASSTRGAGATDILRDIIVEKISSTDVPAEFAKCCALNAAREDFERIFTYDLTSKCRDFRQSTRGTFNDTQLSESLLAAKTDVSALLQIEQRRDKKLRAYGRTWRSIRSLVEASQVLFGNVAKLLPEAIAEAAAIEDETMRRRAQNLCLFAARCLKRNLKYVRECDCFVEQRDPNSNDINAAISRNHQALIERIKSKQMHNPTTCCRDGEETYRG